MTRRLTLKDKVEGMQKEIEELTVEQTEDRPHVSALKTQIARLQRDLTDHKARAVAKSRPLAASADKLEAIVNDYSGIINFDYAVEDRRIDE